MDNIKEFDENEAVKFMRAGVAPEIAAKYDDDELFNLIDLIYDYYESNGMLDIDVEDDDDDELDVDDLNSYIARMLRKDKGASLSSDDASAFVRAYLAYEDSLY